MNKTFDELCEIALSDSPEAVDAAVEFLEKYPPSEEDLEYGQQLAEQHEESALANIRRIASEGTDPASTCAALSLLYERAEHE